MKFQKHLTEASLSRTYEHMVKHATGVVTAFRYARDCGDGEVYTKKENLQRNKKLRAQLQSKRYGVTKMKGSAIENYGTPKAREVSEDIFFVADLKDRGNLEKNLRSLGEEYEQDSILFVPLGGESAELIGTNHCPDAYPGYNQRIKFPKRQFGKDGEFFTKVRGRPWLFEEVVREYNPPEGFFGRWGCYGVANTDWELLE